MKFTLNDRLARLYHKASMRHDTVAMWAFYNEYMYQRGIY